MAEVQKRRESEAQGRRLVEYTFEVTIDVKEPLVDDKHLREIVDDEIRRLAATIKQRPPSR